MCWYAMQAETVRDSKMKHLAKHIGFRPESGLKFYIWADFSYPPLWADSQEYSLCAPPDVKLFLTVKQDLD